MNALYVQVWLLYLAFLLARSELWIWFYVFFFFFFLILTLDYFNHVVQANFLQKKRKSY